VGDHYMDDSFVFGPALIEAVRLEKRARWPRVILDETAIEFERHHSTYFAEALQSAQSRCLVRDEEDVVFVDPLGIYIDEEDDPAALEHFLGLHRNATVTGLASHSRYSEPWLKWRWLADYQNHALASRLEDPEPYMVPVDSARALFASFLDPTWGTSPGSPWFIMDRRDRYRLDGMALEAFIPAAPAAYAVYRNGERMYVGETGNLHSRVIKYHLGRSPSSIMNSALRRNLAQHLGIAAADDIRAARRGLNESERERMRAWLLECEIAWTEHGDKASARAHQRELLTEFVPPLNRKVRPSH
jgi:hypothetical protein